MTNERSGFRSSGADRGRSAEPQEGRFKKIIWNRNGTHAHFSLVKVPKDVPIAITYNKPGLELDFRLRPSGEPQNWLLEGVIDTDIVEMLGMPVATPRKGDTHATMTAREIEMLKRLEPSEVSVDPDCDELLDVSLTLPVEQAANLLRKVWRPHEYAGKNPFILEPTDGRNRILPQKRTVQENYMGVTITVVRFTP